MFVVHALASCLKAELQTSTTLSCFFVCFVGHIPLFTKITKKIVYLVSFVFVIYQILLPVYAFMPDMKERSLHLMFALLIIFLGGPAQKARWKQVLDVVLTIIGAGCCLYVFFRFSAIIEQYGIASGAMQVWMGFALVLIILEAARRMVRPALPIITGLFLLYALYGHLMPGQFGHPPYMLRTLGSMFYLTTGGIWGQLLGVSANIIAIFVCLGSFIVYTGGGTGFMKIAVRLAGKYTGGPAKVAVIASALFGSVSGSASANVASTGAFTIPMMKRLGYPPALAAAVEAVASTGGQIMPPIMGAGAFIMAELIQTPYLKIAASALIPGVLYFLTVGMGIHFYALRQGYRGLSDSEIPDWQSTLRVSGFFLIPFVTLAIWLIRGYTPQYAAFWAIVSTLPLACFSETWSLEFRSSFKNIEQAVLTSARQAALIASICASAQIIIAIIAFTGIGVKVSSSILSLSQNNLFLALVLTGVTSLLLGMEVPTTAAYTVAVVVGGPVLEKLGLPPLAAHLFVFYLAILSAVTPPVCGAVFIAAGMAEADWIKTAKFSLKLSFAAFILPFLFAYHPSLILLGTPLQIVAHSIRATLALLLISAGFMGYWKTECSFKTRSVLLFAGGLLCIPNVWSNLTGICLGLTLWYLPFKKGQ
ncbi:TRAP transporter, 4TM/12TM fusion protein [Candidatus Vecturithrix granuli]|uniref:TRAP transporter, 4TM/12TM fusion protein n=1 Tax=Vecturithrix granuli TaxID=1499967 RepID=A0A0S6WBN1_VECG1|nr:TRAP transporter, 4TM/12TM fusion protein [Candidatus Vecturithrix granuli]